MVWFAIVLWAAAIAFLAAGAVIHHWPDVRDVNRRRGFDVLPPPVTTTPPHARVRPADV